MSEKEIAGNSIQHRIDVMIENAMKMRNEELALETAQKAIAMAQDIQDPLARGKAIFTISRIYHNYGKFHKALEIVSMVKELVRDLAEPSFLSQIQTAIGGTFWRLSRFHDAIRELDAGIAICEEHGLKSNMMSLNMNRGLVNLSLGNLDKSLEDLNRALEIAIELDDQVIIKQTYLNLQSYFYQIEDYDRLEKYALKTVELARAQEDRRTECMALNNLAVAFKERGDLDAASQRFRELINLQRMNKEPVWSLENPLMNLGLVETLRGNHEEGLFFLDEALSLTDETSLIETRILMRVNKGLALEKLERLDEAIAILEEAVQLGRDHDRIDETIAAQTELANAMAAKGKYQQAFKMIRETLSLRTRKFNSEIADRVASLQSQFDFELKDQEYRLLQSEKQKLSEKNEELEAALRKLREAQEEIRELDRRNSINAMAVTANHELNQPLMIIQGNIEMITSRLGEEDHELRRYVERIEQAVKRIEKILRKYRDARSSRLGSYAGTTAMVEFLDDDPES